MVQLAAVPAQRTAQIDAHDPLRCESRRTPSARRPTKAPDARSPEGRARALVGHDVDFGRQALGRLHPLGTLPRSSHARRIESPARCWLGHGPPQELPLPGRRGHRNRSQCTASDQSKGAPGEQPRPLDRAPRCAAEALRAAADARDAKRHTQPPQRPKAALRGSGLRETWGARGYRPLQPNMRRSSSAPLRKSRKSLR